MAKENVSDRIRNFLLEKGDQGATSIEIATLFLGTSNPPEKLAEKVVGSILGNDSRFTRGKDGRWHAAAPSKKDAGPEIYSVVEFAFAGIPQGEPLPIECAVIRVEEGKETEPRATSMKPNISILPNAQMPHDLSIEDIQRSPQASKVLDRLNAFISGTTMVCYEKTPSHARVGRAPDGTELECISIKKLARRLEIIPRQATIRDCAEALEVICPEHPRAAEMAKSCLEMYNVLLTRLEEMGISSKNDVYDFMQPQYFEVDFTQYDFDWGFLDTLPEEPGVYIMKDANGAPLYVGKARNLRGRVTSYFRRRTKEDERSKRIRERISGISIERTGSELEAILLEGRYIRELSPELNQQVKTHERPAHFQRPQNVIVIQPSRAAESVEMFILSGGTRLTQLRAPVDDVDSARDAITEACFRTNDKSEPTDKADIELVWAWLHHFRDKTNVIDIDAIGNIDEIMRLLKDYISDIDSSEAPALRV